MSYTPWRVSKITLANGENQFFVTDSGGNSRGGGMSKERAWEIVDAHNLDADPSVIDEFRGAVSAFLQEQFSKILADDEDTSRNYWPILVLMTDGLVAQMLAATNPIGGNLKLK